jgi:putative PIN family toxin of toxin-antitoxin system
MSTKVVLDTNLFVAAGFNPDSHSAQLIEMARNEEIQLIWNGDTKNETNHVLSKIPPLSWDDFSDIFRDKNKYVGKTHPENFGYIPDPTDRKFAALADATGAILVTQDEDLIGHRKPGEVTIYATEEYFEHEA